MEWNSQYKQEIRQEFLPFEIMLVRLLTWKGVVLFILVQVFYHGLDGQKTQVLLTSDYGCHGKL